MFSLGSWFERPAGPRDWWRVLPGDAMGLMIMRFIGVERPTRVHDAGDVVAYVIEDERVARFFKINLIPTRAQTFGRFVFATYELDPETLAHECQHIRQWAKLGPAYLPSYFAASGLEFLAGRRAYWDNAFETAARDRAAQEIAAAAPAVARDSQPG
jgi:hypothetical protein